MTAWLEKATSRVGERLERAEEARLVTPQGRDLRFVPKGRKATAMAGSAREL